jgi:hypothetical protein
MLLIDLQAQVEKGGYAFSALGPMIDSPPIASANS